MTSQRWTASGSEVGSTDSDLRIYVEAKHACEPGDEEALAHRIAAALSGPPEYEYRTTASNVNGPARHPVMPEGRGWKLVDKTCVPMYRGTEVRIEWTWERPKPAEEIRRDPPATP